MDDTIPKHIAEGPGIEDYDLPLHTSLQKRQLHIEDLDMIRGGARGDGHIKPLFANVVTLLKAEDHFFNLRFDEFSQCAYRGDEKLTDTDFLDIAFWVQKAGVHADIKNITSAVMYIAQQCRFHQVRDYLTPLKWDGTERLPFVLIENGGAPQTEIVMEMTKRWFIQAVARIFEPGCQADTMLILEGDQGLRKSSLFKALADPWYTSQISDFGEKDSKQEVRGIWMIEVAELDGMKKGEVSSVKSFLTTRTDRYRDSYARTVQEFPRQCVFCGTVNPGGDGYLKDETGGRRFWPIPITEEINVQSAITNRDQYWAEAVHRYRKREPWYLDTVALNHEARNVQSDRFETDEWATLIEKWLIGAVDDFVTSGIIMREVLSISSPAEWGKSEQMRVSRIVRHAGWVKVRDQKALGRPWGFCRPGHEANYR